MDTGYLLMCAMFSLPIGGAIGLYSWAQHRDRQRHAAQRAQMLSATRAATAPVVGSQDHHALGAAWRAQVAANKQQLEELDGLDAGIALYERDFADAVASTLKLDRSQSRQPGPCTLSLSYRDVDGVMTQRDVAIYRSGSTNNHFEAWCALRKARRTFYFDNILKAVDIRSGKTLSRADLFRHVHPTRKMPPAMVA